MVTKVGAPGASGPVWGTLNVPFVGATFEVAREIMAPAGETAINDKERRKALAVNAPSRTLVSNFIITPDSFMDPGTFCETISQFPLINCESVTKVTTK